MCQVCSTPLESKTMPYVCMYVCKIANSAVEFSGVQRVQVSGMTATILSLGHLFRGSEEQPLVQTRI